MSDVFNFGQVRVSDANGDPIPGALATFYIAGTNTLAPIKNAAGAALANPQVADAGGVFSQLVYADTALKVAVTTASGAAVPGYPMDLAFRSVGSAASASSVSFNPTVGIPVTNVQAALESVYATIGSETSDAVTLSDAQTITGAKTLTGVTTLSGNTSATGVTTTSVSDGTPSAASTYRPDPLAATPGNMRHITNNAAFTLAAPNRAGDYTMTVLITNGASAGAVTFSGFTRVVGDALTTTNASTFFVSIVKQGGVVRAVVEANQ